MNLLQKVGLVLEGGGMRGVYTSGVQEYLLDHQIYYPYVVGVSAGASNSCNYVARQKGRGKRVNLNYIHDWRYMSLRSLLCTGSYFGLDFLFGDIPDKLDVFDYETFFNTPGVFRIGATNCLTGKTDYFDKHEITTGLKHLKASCSLPLLSPAVKINGVPYLDGGIADPIPVRQALHDGCERVVVVLTQPAGYRKKPASHKMKFLYRNVFAKYPELVRALEARDTQYNDTLDYVEALEKKGIATVIRPDGSLKLDRFEKDAAVLGALFEQGYRDAARKLEERGRA
jgi:predicted patatin/cPLA2 family phospholipase